MNYVDGCSISWNKYATNVVVSVYLTRCEGFQIWFIGFPYGTIIHCRELSQLELNGCPIDQYRIGNGSPLTGCNIARQ